ncbi:hypothetical protein F751_0959 [Auxenochlorella protothecoides]|uniref:Uncharacterized protein n=1 Tax=Auxenochlorella protothecoides TaxID=3075 RepID=A0A087SDE1_AUXPR|nr:hypothetical protein F751_0959 [Auxenochlorella protothecoides]KFM23745.1 hypothetical protein F751_0959 [Auxenochlorella protothecoides]
MLTGLQLPKSDDWRMFTVPEVLKILDLERVCATEGSKLTAKKRRAVEACLQSKREEFEVDVDEDGQLRKGRKVVKAEKTERKKTEWFVHIGWAFFALLFNFRRFEGCGWRDRPPEDAKIHMYVGIDPGRTNMFTAIDEHANVTSCSSKEFHAMSGSQRRQKTIASWHAKAPDYVKKLHQCPTYKTASTAVLLSRVVKIVPDLRRGLAWHRDGKPFRKLWHQAYVGRQRAITRLAEQFRAPPGRTTIVGVGNWSAQDRGGIMRGPPPGPWIRFLRRLRRVCRVVVVDEHRSSKLCCACHATLHAHQYVRVRNGEEKLVDVWDTKRCTNKACKVNVVNRDVNGAANMLMLTKQPTAPVRSRLREAAVQPAQAR